MQAQLTRAKAMYTVRNQFMCLKRERFNEAVASGSISACTQHASQVQF